MNLREEIEKLVVQKEKELDGVLEELREENPDASFYELYCGDDGPYSFGNYDDVYSDGFTAGTYSGQDDIIQLLKELLKNVPENT